MSDNDNPKMSVSVYSHEMASDEMKKLAFTTAVNTALELEQAFKLMSFRVTNQADFVQRVLDCCEYLTRENRILLKQLNDE